MYQGQHNILKSISYSEQNNAFTLHDTCLTVARGFQLSLLYSKLYHSVCLLCIIQIRFMYYMFVLV